MERFLNYFEPTKYNLELLMNKNNKKIGGLVKVSGRVLNRTIKFHAVNLEVIKVLVDDKEVSFEVKDGALVVSDLELGETEVKIYYRGTLNENMQGAYLSTYEYRGQIEKIVATQFESHYAREAFPCIDEPAAKAIFEVKLLIPKENGEIVLSNMPEIDVKNIDNFDGKIDDVLLFYDEDSVKKVDRIEEHSFEPTPRMSTYLLAWVIGKFHGKSIKNEHGVEITTYCSLAQELESVDFANEIAARSLEYYDDNFGVDYPLRKLDQVALPDFEAGAMENWGLVTYRESMLLASATATLGTKKGIALTVAHELSHQWFGDLVTMAWWDDLWLNESFASVMEYYAVDKIHPEYKIFEGFFTGDSYLALLRDAYTDVQSVHQEVRDPAEIATLFDSAIVYSKGARLMLMLIRTMGWREFCKGIKDYFEKYKYQNTVGDNLWDALEPYAKIDVKKLMHSFIDRPGYPVITDGKQKRFLLDGEMTEGEWILPEITEDMSGHYILNLDNDEFEERLANFEELGLEEKIRLLIDRSLITRTKLASAETLIPLILKFKDEDSAAVWNIIVSIVANLKVFFEPDSQEELMFKQFVGRLVKDKLSEVGLVTRVEDDENTIRLRAILLGLDYYAETRENIETLAKMYDDDVLKMDPEIREDIIEAKLYLEPAMVNKYIKKYQKTAEPEIKSELLFAGTLSKDLGVLEKMMGLLGKTNVVKLQDQLYLFVYLYRNARAREKAFSWLRENWERIYAEMGDKTVDSYPRYMANVIRTEGEFREWRDFFWPMRNDAILARAIKIGEKEIKARLELIEKDKVRVIVTLRES